jgi:hypothetical protein
MDKATRRARPVKTLWAAAAVLCVIAALALPAMTVAGNVVHSAGVITISATPSSVKLGQSFVLTGTVPVPVNGTLVAVMVKKPGKAYYSYSSLRGTYNATDGVSTWWYRYTPKLRGTYVFYASLVATSGYLSGPTSARINVRVR